MLLLLFFVVLFKRTICHSFASKVVEREQNARRATLHLVRCRRVLYVRDLTEQIFVFFY